MIDFQLVKVAALHQGLFCSLYSEARANFQRVLRLSQKANPSTIYRVITVTSKNNAVQFAGFVRLTMDKFNQSEKVARIGTMLLAEFEGQGLAYQAQKLLMSEAHQMDYCQFFTTYCAINNERAHRLYQRLGFHKVQQLLYNQQPSIQWQWGN